MKIFKLVAQELKKHLAGISAVLILILLGKLLLIALPFLLKAVVDSLIYESNWATGLNIYPPLIVAAYASVFFLASFFDEVKEFLSEKTIQPSIAEVAQKVFEVTTRLPISFYLDSKTGVIMREFDRGIRSLQSLSSLTLYTALPLLIEIVAVILIFFLNYSSKFGLIISIGIALHITVTIFLTPSLVGARKDLNLSDSAVNGYITESFINFESMKLFSSSSTQANHLKKLFNQYVGKAIKFQLLHSKLKIIQRGIIALTLGFLLWDAATDVMYGTITPGDFVLINSFALQVLLPISAMGILWKEFGQCYADVKSLNHITNLSEEISAPNQKLLTLSGPPKIEFLNVSYRYPNGKVALNNISFCLNPGSITALVGENGSGKTTILRLLMGLIHPTSGKIYINNQEMSVKQLESIRPYMGIVPQHVSLFDGSIAFNLTYGQLDQSIEKAKKLARLVDLENHITNNFPNGFDTAVGERGQKLSGGERQKIGLARALSNNPKILILDEASSFLDASAESTFKKLTKDSLGHQTTIMVTHNPEGLAGEVKVLSLKNGSIISKFI